MTDLVTYDCSALEVLGSVRLNLDLLDDHRCSDNPNESLILDEKEEANRSTIPIGSSFIESIV